MPWNTTVAFAAFVQRAVITDLLKQGVSLEEVQHLATRPAHDAALGPSSKERHAEHRREDFDS